MANWWEEKDEFGYTYADKNRPGYMGPVPKEEEVQGSEEEIVDDSAGWNVDEENYDFGSGQDYIDSFEELEVTEDDKKFVKNIEKDNYESFQPEIKEAARQEEMMEVGEDFKMELPEEEITPFAKQLEGVEPSILQDVNKKAEKNIKSLMKKAVGAKGKQRSDGYANVYKALEAYKGKETPFLKGLKTRFSKKASDTKNKQHLGDYVDYFNRGYSWQARRQAAPQPQTRFPGTEGSGELGHKGQRAKSIFEAEKKDGHSLDFDFDQPANTDDLRDDYTITDFSNAKTRGTKQVAQLSDAVSYSSSNIVDSDRNKGNLRDGLYMPSQKRPKLNVLGIPFIVSENHLAEGGPHGKKYGNYAGWQKKVYPNGLGFALVKNEMGEDKLVKLEDAKRWNFGLDMFTDPNSPKFQGSDNREYKEKYQNKIISFSPGTVVQIDDELTAADKEKLRRAGMSDSQLRRRKYPSMWGRRTIIRSDDVREFDGKPHQIYFQYGHGAKTAFNHLKVGDTVKLGDALGNMGDTNQNGVRKKDPSTGRYIRGYGVPDHIDVHAFILVRDKGGKSKKVFLSPTEWLPRGEEGDALSFGIRAGAGFSNGGVVEEKEYPTVKETLGEPQILDVGYNFEDFGSAQDYIDEIGEENIEEVAPFSKQIQGSENYVEMPQDDVGPSPAQQKVADAEAALGHLDERRKEQEKLNQQKNLIEESREQLKVEGPDAEMVRKSHAEITSMMDDVDPRTGKFSLEAKQYLAQIPRQTLMDYRDTYAASKDKYKINDLIVQQESILKESDKADSIQVGKTQKQPVRKVSELKYLKIKEYKDREDLEKARTEAINLAMKQSKIDPKRLFKNRSTMDKVVGLLGRVAGLYGSVKYGGPDYYEQHLDKEIAKDIQAQKLDQEFAKRQLAAANFKVAALAKRYALSATSVKDKQNFNKINLSYLAKGQKVLDKQIKEKKKMADLATLNRRGISSNELAYLMAKYPKLKIQESLITARDGKHYYIMGGKQGVKKIKDSLADTQDSIDGLRDLEGYVDKVGIWNQGWAPWSFLSRDKAEAEALRDRLVGKLRIEFFGPGVMTDNEREQAKKILGDPNAFWTTDEREKAKIRSLIMKLNYGMRQKLRRDGLTMLPLSPNERRVSQLLKKNNLGDNPNNRVKIVDSLIAAEKEAVLGGGKPGKFWDMNEPLPI